MNPLNEAPDAMKNAAPRVWREPRDLAMRTQDFGMEPQAFMRTFPFCLHIDAELRVLYAGTSLVKAYPAVQPGVALAQLFVLRRPSGLVSIDDWRRHAGEHCTLTAPAPTSMILRGTAELFDDGSMLLLVSPVLPSLDDMARLGLSFNDFAKLDASVDLLMLAQTARASVQDAVRISHRLQSRTEQLSTILELSTSAVVYFDETGAVQHANTALLDMLALERIATFDLTIPALDRWITGLLAPDTLRRPLDTLMKRHPEYSPVAESTQASFSTAPTNWVAEPACATGAKSRVPQRRFTDYSLGDQTGSEASLTLHFARPRPAVIHVGAARSAGGGWVFYFRDVTHETEVDRMKSEFLATAAHELRTPMVSVFGFTELLLNRPVREDQRRDMLETIHRQSKLLITMVNEMLDLARIEARQGKDMKRVPSRLGMLVDPVLALFDSPSGVERQRLQVRLAAHVDTPVRVDIDKTQRAITNVLANAFKYASGTSPITLDSLDGTLYGAPAVGLRITDTGIGMTPTQTARVFERFYRADPSGNTPGTGLGMSLVREIIELHGGSVDIDSELERGTAVTLWWPVLQEVAGA